MIIVYGTRHYGVTDKHEGEYAVTRCFHIMFLPLVPISQMWVRRSNGSQLLGLPMRVSWRSGFAAFARPWGAVAAVAGVATGGVGGVATAVIGAAAAAWAFSWRSLRGARAKRSSDLLAEVTGVRCPPKLLHSGVAESLRDSLDQTWGKLSPDRPPEDAAQYGARNPAEAAVAYSIFAVRAQLERGASAQQLQTRADRLLDAVSDPLQLPDATPYRASVDEPRP